MKRMCKTKKRRYKFNVAKIVHKVIVDYSCVLSHNEKKTFYNSWINALNVYSLFNL